VKKRIVALLCIVAMSIGFGATVSGGVIGGQVPPVIPYPSRACVDIDNNDTYCEE